MTTRPRVLVTRPADRAGPLLQSLRTAGLDPVAVPLIETRPVGSAHALRSALAAPRLAWAAFMSATAVEMVDRLPGAWTALRLSGARAAAVGTGTRHALESRGVAVDFVPTQFTGAALGAALPAAAGERVLLLQARDGRRDAADALRRRDCVVDEVELYETVAATSGRELEEALRDGVEAVLFLSPSAVDAFAIAAGAGGMRLVEQAVVGCIGPVTASAARRHGITVTVEPAEHTAEALASAVARQLVAVQRG